jgi:beta-glucosidase
LTGPVPLGAVSSFDPSVVTADDTVGARETATVGIKQIYSPMVPTCLGRTPGSY